VPSAGDREALILAGDIVVVGYGEGAVDSKVVLPALIWMVSLWHQVAVH